MTKNMQKERKFQWNVQYLNLNEFVKNMELQILDFFREMHQLLCFFKFESRLYRIDLHFQNNMKYHTEIEGRKIKAEERRKWRVLILTIKAMLESIENDVLTAPFLLQPFTVLPGNTVLGERISSQIDQAYLTGNMLTFLLVDKE
jgi:hypothetical protein